MVKKINWPQTIFVSLFIWGAIIIIFGGAILYLAELLGESNNVKEIMFLAVLLLIIIKELGDTFRELSFKVYKKKRKAGVRKR